MQCAPGALSSGVKRPWREADSSPPSSAKVKNGGAIPPLPHVFMACYLIKPRDTFTFTGYNAFENILNKSSRSLLYILLS
jgi:hypothetical protein